ncbi:MAG: hypothetical protein ACU837_15750 [Gammaproteobacteria bacterium]
MKKQQLSEKPAASRRRFLKTMAVGSAGILGGWTLLATAKTQTATTTGHAGRAFSASTIIDIESVNKQSSGRQAV